MSDITGPPAPKELQPSVRSTDKTSQTAKDPGNTGAGARNQQQSDTSSRESNTPRTRDPAVSISATAARVRVGEQINTSVRSVDSEGRPLIVTDKATFALKPDAGLQVDDRIVLKISEADKAIIADLLSRNNYALHPPPRVELIVTEIHGRQNDNTADQNPALQAAISKPYRPPLTAPIKTETIIPGTPTIRPEVTVLSPSPENARVPSGSQNTLQGNASPNGAISTSETAGQSPASTAGTLPPSAGQSPETGQTLSRTEQASSTAPGAHAIPAIATSAGAVTGPGIGPAITALSTTGQSSIIQVLDPAVSKVPPTEIATVQQVSPLTAAHAVALDTSGGKLLSTFDTSDALSVLETSRGTFIASTHDVAALTGEIIRVAQGPVTESAVSGTATAQAPPTAPTYPALLIAVDDGALPQKVAVSFEQAETSGNAAQQLQTATVNSVTTQAAFLSPAGPKTDIRLQTSAGDISLTVPSSARPAAGDSIHIHWPEQAPPATASPAPATPVSPVETTAAEASNLQATAATATASAGILSNWPALQETIAAVAASGNTAATAALQGKTAQGGTKLTNSLLFFLAAAGRAGPRAWIGQDAQQSLQDNAPSLLRQLSSDISQMSTMAGDRSGEWRAFMLPLDARGETVPLAALLLQAHPDIDPDKQGKNNNDRDKERPDDQRFILQVQFSVLGDIQLDGRISKQQFDLTVRSAATFNPALQADLKGLFDASLAANGFAGMLKFEEQYPFPVDAEAIIENKLAPSS